MKLKRFWDFKNDGDGLTRELRIDGVIGDGESWLEDEISPKLFRDELNAGRGRVKLWLNSPGGDVFAASQIYTALKEYKDGVDVYIDGIAASAASVIAMAGENVLMSPTSLIMIHNPTTSLTRGNRDEMAKAIAALDEIKKSIVSAYVLKTKLPRDEISKMMDAEKFLNAEDAVKLGFADKILYKNKGEKKIMNVRNLIEKRNEIWNRAEEFLDAHTNANGLMADNDAATYDELKKQVDNLTSQIKRYNDRQNFNSYINTPTTKPIFPDIGDSNTKDNGLTFGVGGKDYRRDFLNAVRNGFSNDATQYLRIADPAQGGYLVPTEMHNEIIVGLRENNILRKISRVIQTASAHRIPLQITAPTAQWTDEGEAIKLSHMAFDQKTLNAYKLTVATSVTNEIRADSGYPLEQHIISEFSVAMAAQEEETFFTGNGENKPKGILNQLSEDMIISTAGAAIAADDIVNLVYKLKRPYRKNAVFVMADETLAAIRKLKDMNQNYIWDNDYKTAEPPVILGYPVYTTPYLNNNNDSVGITDKKPIILFGDFSKFIIGNRGNFVFKPLYELLALNDLSAYILTARVDCVLTDTDAIAGLKL